MTAVAARWRPVQRLVEACALFGFSLPNGVHASSAAPGTPSNYEVIFQTPWEEGVSEGLQHLEHIYLSIPTQAPAKKLYYDVLGFAPDARRLHNLQKGSGTIWANIGSSVMTCFTRRGGIAGNVVWPSLAVAMISENMPPLEKKLKGSNFSTTSLAHWSSRTLPNKRNHI